MQTGQARKQTGRISILLSLAVLVLVVAAVLLTYLAPPAYAQTFPNFSGGWNGSRVQSGAIPTGLTPNSNQTLTLHQVSPGGNVVGNLSTYWPGTPYYWTSYASGTISGSTLALSWTVTAQNMPAGTGGCGETLNLALATSGSVTTATVPTHHPCGSITTTINTYPLTLTGWQKMYGTETSGCSGPCIMTSPLSGSIDVSTGNIIDPVTDYETAGPNKLSLVRYYNTYTAASRLTSSYFYIVSNNVPHVTTNYDRGLVQDTVNNTMTAYRPDGSQLVFKLVSGVWTPDTDVDMTLVNTSGSTWKLTDHDDTVETYTMGTGGRALLNTIATRNGYTQTLAYNPGTGMLSTVTDSYSRALTFNYTGSYLTSVNTPDSLVLSYSYSSSTGGTNDRIASVSYNTSPVTSQTFNYANSSFPLSITSVTDENGNTWKTYTYDTYGRALTQQTGTGANADITSVTYNDAAGTSTVTNALGQSTVQTFTALQGRNKSTLISRTASASVPAATSSMIYDSNGYVGTSSDWNGIKTVYTNNAHGDPTTIVEASGTAVARTTTIAYDTTWVHLPATITTTGLTTGFTYDSNGNPLTQVLTDTTTQTIPYSTNGQTRTTNFTWSNFLPLTVQTPNGNTTTFTFGTDGALTNIKNALLQNTAITVSIT